MKKILVPTDFSDCSEMALRYAVYLAKKTGGQITLIHVCDLLDDNFTNMKQIIREYNKAKIAELTSSLKHLKECVEKDDVVITTELYNGKIVDSILTASEEHQADLIVMGTLGATGIKKLFFGTKAAAVINESVTPVITIPYDYKKPALKKILMALNNRKQHPEIFEPVFNLRTFFGARLKTVVFTEKDADESKMLSDSKVASHLMKQLKTQFPGNGVESDHIYGKDFHQSIQDYVEKQKADMLVMLTHQRTFMQNLFRLNMTRQMAYHINIPLMSLKGTDLKN